MKFGSVPLDDALGAILAHSKQTDKGRLRKGRVLTADDLEVLRTVADSVVVAVLEDGDMHEDAAASGLADALCTDWDTDGLRRTRAATGRVNIYATGHGVLALDPDRIRAANLVDPMITIATLPQYSPVRDGTMVATIKIISYGVDEAALGVAAGHLAGALRRVPVAMASATLIHTLIDQPVSKKATRAIENRLKVLGMALVAEVSVGHDVAELAQAVGQATGDLILIMTASATSDIRDVGPEAVRRAGGEVMRFGIPVDPGNLLFLGRVGMRPVIGLPGCAKSPAMNGVDWVLERVVCGLDVSNADLAGMGVGGLLKETDARGLARETKS